MSGRSTLFALAAVLSSTVPASAQDSDLTLAPPPDASRGGFLGVQLADAIPEAVLAHLGIHGGAMVLDVVAASPAAAAGLARHDVIIAVDGDPVKNADDLRRRIAKHAAGDAARLSVRRGATTLELVATLATHPSGIPPVDSDTPPATPAPRQPGFLGVRFEAVPAALAAHLGIEPGVGVVLAEALEGAPAAEAGLTVHDVILSVDGEPVHAHEVEPESDGGDWPLFPSLPPAPRAPRAPPAVGAPPAPRAPRAPPAVGAPPPPEYFVFPAGAPDVPATESNLPELVGKHFAGDEVTLAVIHRGERREARVRLGARPAATAWPPSDPHAPGNPGAGAAPGGRRQSLRVVPRARIFGAPRAFGRGKIRWRDASGAEREIELPRFEGLRGNLRERVERQLRDAGQEPPDGVISEIERAFENLELEFDGLGLDVDLDLDLDFGFDSKTAPPNAQTVPGAPGLPASRSWPTQRSASEIVTHDGRHEIRVREENGRRTVTVKEDASAIATDLPWEQLDSLPEAVRDKVREAARGLDARPGGAVRIEERHELVPPNVRDASDTPPVRPQLRLRSSERDRRIKV